MKINEKIGLSRAIGNARQILRIMKLTILIMTVFLLQVSATTKAQITINAKQESLRKVLGMISKQSGYDLIYSVQDFKNAKPVSINLNNVSVEKALEISFEGQPLTYEVTEKTVMIRKQDDKLVSNRISTYLAAIDVRGRVVDQNNVPLSGATVKIKGTGNVTTTDAKGEFYLKDVDDDAAIVVSYVGFTPLETFVKSEMGDIKMNDINAKLDEVQVIAYGTVQKKYSTSNINSIKAEAIATQPVTNPLLALSGRVPGLFIKQPSGVAGDGVEVVVQGRNSMSNGNDPFYVIDGVPFPSQMLSSLNGTKASPFVSALNYINPGDIESIEILKDADATAIYGSRAANGAILITTKRGKAGTTKVDLNVQHGWGQITRKLNLLNTSEYIALRKEALANAGLAIGASDYDINGVWDANKNTDWQKELVGGTSRFTNANASISGGSENTQFIAGGGFNKQTTVYPTNLGDTKGNVHFNINHSSTNRKFKLNLNGNYQQDINRLGAQDLMQYAIVLAPNAPDLYNSDGSLNWGSIPGSPGAYSFDNPLKRLLRTFTGKTENLISNSLLSYTILPGLELKTSLGYNKLSTDENLLTPITATRPDQINANSRNASYLNSNNTSWIVEPQLTYTAKIGNGNLDVLIGSTFQTTEKVNRSFNASGFTSDGQLENIGAAPTISVGQTRQITYRYNAVFGRVNYRFLDKYILNVNLRRDGSSRFGSENSLHNFYSVGGAWLFGEEDFFKNSISFISQGKLRVTYGTTGNDQIIDYGFLNLYNTYRVDVPYQQIVGLAPAGHANPYLQWEETHKLNLGLELGLFNDALTFNVNYFRNRSSNQLLFYPLLISTGFSVVNRNLPATVQNSGWEFMVDASPLKNGSFKWNASVNLTIPRNKLIRYDNIESSSFASQYVIGQPTNILKKFQFVGVNQQTGLYEFKKADGTLTSTPVDPVDKTALVDLNPKYYGGLYNDFNYKGFQLSFLFQFVKQMGTNYRFGASAPGLFSINEPANYVNRWKDRGEQSDLQKTTLNFSEFLNPYFGAIGSDAAYSDASYIRLKNASVSYNLPNAWMQKANISGAKIFVQGQNLLTITNFEGTDPESQNAIFLPPLRMYILGFQITL